jgi:hypothetical protein
VRAVGLNHEARYVYRMPTKEKVVHTHSCDGITVVTFEDGEMQVGYNRPSGPTVGIPEDSMKKGFKRFSKMPIHPIFGLKGAPCPDCGLANLERCKAQRQRFIVKGPVGYELEYEEHPQPN